jgi:hypothetical protein
MPIDSRDKRSSAIMPNLPWRNMLPAPDGSWNQADRQHVALMYRGILAGGAAAAVTLRKFMGLMRDPGRVGRF